MLEMVGLNKVCQIPQYHSDSKDLEHVVFNFHHQVQQHMDEIFYQLIQNYMYHVLLYMVELGRMP